jgi:hypothetical protein
MLNQIINANDRLRETMVCAASEQCFYFDTVMNEYEDSLLQLAIMAFDTESRRNLLARAASFATGSRGAGIAVGAILAVAADGFRAGRSVGALYRDFAAMQVRFFLNESTVPGMPGYPDARSRIQRAFESSPSDIETWRVALSAAYAAGYEAPATAANFNMIRGFVGYSCRNVGFNDEGVRQCIGNINFPVAATMLPLGSVVPPNDPTAGSDISADDATGIFTVPSRRSGGVTTQRRPAAVPVEPAPPPPEAAPRASLPARPAPADRSSPPGALAGPIPGSAGEAAESFAIGSWNTRGPNSAAYERWRQIILSEIPQTSPLIATVPGGIETFCPSFQKANVEQRRAIWFGLLSALIYEESSYRPSLVNKEVVSGGDEVLSSGLLQLSIRSAQQSQYRCEIRDQADLLDPERNLRCGVRIATYHVGQAGRVDGRAVSANGRTTWLGLASYWGPLRHTGDNARSTARRLASRARIASFTKSLPYCNIP